MATSATFAKVSLLRLGSCRSLPQGCKLHSGCGTILVKEDAVHPCPHKDATSRSAGPSFDHPLRCRSTWRVSRASFGPGIPSTALLSSLAIHRSAKLGKSLPSRTCADSEDVRGQKHIPVNNQVHRNRGQNSLYKPSICNLIHCVNDYQNHLEKHPTLLLRDCYV